MNLPKWAGRTLSVSVYTLRVYWFRCIAVVGVVGASLFWLSAPPETQFRARSTADPVVFSPQSPATTAETSGALRARRVSFSFDAILLEEALDRLRGSGLNIFVSQEAAELMRDEAMTLRLQLSEAPLEDALALMLWDRSELVVRYEGELVSILARDEEEPELSLETYPVAELGLAKEQLLEGLSSCLAEDRGFLDLQRGQLIARVTPEQHRIIAGILKAIRASGQRREEAAIAEASPARRVAELRKLSDCRFQRIEWRRRSLLSTVDRLAAASSIPMMVSPRIDAESLSSTLILDQASADQVLDLVARQHGLTWRLVHGAAVIMSPEEAFEIEARFLDIYDLRDVMAEASGEATIDMILGATGQDDWEAPARATLIGGILIVRQTPKVHAEIRRLLRRLRE